MILGTELIQDLMHLITQIWHWVSVSVSSHPMGFVVALAILPLLGVPIAGICLLGGAVYGIEKTLLLCLVGLSANLAITYLLSAFYMHDFVAGWLQKRGYTLWRADPKHAWKMTLLIRCTPVIPIVIQGCILGVCKVPAPVYFAISIPAEMLYCAMFIISGGSIFEGHAKWLLWGISGLAVLSLLSSIIRHVSKTRPD